PARARAAGPPPRDRVVDLARARARRRARPGHHRVRGHRSLRSPEPRDPAPRHRGRRSAAAADRDDRAHLVRLAVARVGAAVARDLSGIGGRFEKPGLKGLPPVQQLFETTRAYPGHVEHVVRYLLEGGKAEDTTISLPDLVAARLSMLKQSTRDVLQAAAVLGLEPQVDLLRSMLPSDALEAAMADAERAGLFSHDPSGELTFTSRLVRDIVYAAPPADVRRSLHAAAAAAVEALSPDVALLGHHHDLAGHAKESIMLLRRAGDHATEQLDDIGAG